MTDNKKSPEAIIKELTDGNHIQKFWHSHKLFITYSYLPETSCIYIPFTEKQTKAFELAIKSYEEIIPIKFKKVIDIRDRFKFNNIFLYNANKHSAIFKSEGYEGANATCYLEYCWSLNWKNFLEKDRKRIKFNIIYNYEIYEEDYKKLRGCPR